MIGASEVKRTPTASTQTEVWSGNETALLGSGLPFDTEIAREWVRNSLSRGTSLAAAALPLLELPGRATVLVPRASEMQNGLATDLSLGQSISTDEADKLAGEFLGDAERKGARTLIVEDIASKDDPNLGDHVAFMGKRVLSWAELSHSLHAAWILRVRANGYPLNAFVSDSTVAQLGVRDGQEVRADFIEGVVTSLRCIVVAAFDAETFLIWSRDASGSEPLLIHEARKRLSP